MRRLNPYVLASCLFLYAGLALADGEVAAIKVRKTGPGPLDEAFVKAHIEYEVGMKFERFALSRDIKALMKTGRFSDIKVYAEEDGEDVRLIYEVVNRHILSAPVEIEGEDRFTHHHVRQLIGLEPGDYVDDAVLGLRSLKVKDEYQGKHYPDIEVTWKIATDKDKDGSAHVTVIVDEGKKVKVAGVVFTGNEVFSQYELGRLMKRPAWWNPCWWMRRQKFDEDQIFTGRVLVRERYRNEGYLDVAVSDVAYDRNEEGDILLKVDVREGRQFKINKILLSGVDKFPESAIRKVLKLEAGDLASSLKMIANVNAVRDFYGSRGYIDTGVRRVLKPNADNPDTLDLIIKIEEGKLCFIRRIDIEGNTRTRDKVIRRELLVDPGDIYNEVTVRASERRLSNLGYFSSVRSFPTATPLDDQRNLTFEVEEQRTGQFMMGAGFSSIDKATVFMEVSQGNFDLLNWPSFTGGGQKLKLSGQLGSSRRDFLISFTEPWFLNRKLRFGFELYDRLVKYDDYDSRRTGGSVGVGKAVSSRGRMDLRYSLEKLTISDIADTNEYFTETGESYYFAEIEDSVSSSIRMTYTYDKRDNPFIPTKGQKFRLYGGLTGGPLGFDTDIYETGISFNKYVPAWKNHVLSLRASYDVVEEFDDTVEVPIADRLFLGGGRTLRGFKYRDVGPKVIRTVDLGGGVTAVDHKPIGGGSRFMATAEYSIPVVTPIRFALFYDTGNVWSAPYELDSGDLASSWGGGLRFDVPGFPIRIDYADVIKKDDELTETESWVLWIGYDF